MSALKLQRHRIPPDPSQLFNNSSSHKLHAKQYVVKRLEYSQWKQTQIEMKNRKRYQYPGQHLPTVRSKLVPLSGWTLAAQSIDQGQGGKGGGRKRCPHLWIHPEPPRDRDSLPIPGESVTKGGFSTLWSRNPNCEYWTWRRQFVMWQMISDDELCEYNSRCIDRSMKAGSISSPTAMHTGQRHYYLYTRFDA